MLTLIRANTVSDKDLYKRRHAARILRLTATR